jgi:4-diphosphocytidyl-2-C-methyl-D-erythritol kinase
MMPPQSKTEFAPAKVNLTLHVTGQRADGYHLLDSLVVFCGIGDRITVQPATAMSLTLTGPFAHGVPPGDDNLVMRAARAFGGDVELAIKLEKNLPVASGLGGGSADAAAVIRAVLRFREDLDLAARVYSPQADSDTVLSLGADVPVCLGSRPAHMRGIGEDIDWLGSFPETYIVLVNPRVAVPTPAVFAALLKKQNLPMPENLPGWPDAASLARWLALQRNDLEAPAKAIAPVIGEVLTLLDLQQGALICRMSGSGATCFAIFATEHAANAAAEAIRHARPDWWTAAGPILLGSPDRLS